MYRTIELSESDWSDVIDGTLTERVRDSMRRQLDNRNIRISEVPLPTQYREKVFRICRKFHIDTLGDLTKCDPFQFRLERGIGLSTIRFLMDLLSDYGLHFGHGDSGIAGYAKVFGKQDNVS